MSYNLAGCRPDVLNLQRLLIEKYGFASSNVNVILDGQATAQAMKDALNMLVQGIEIGDTILFAFSGHGTQKGFRRPNEEDGKDEALVPFDISYNNLITDDDLNNIIMQVNPATGTPYLPDDGSVNFTAIYDCCHSGTLIRDLALEDFKLDLTAPILNRCIKFPELIDNPIREVQLGPYTVLSACRDEETAADVPAERIPGSISSRGAFSYALHKLVEDNTRKPLSQIESDVPDIIKGISRHVQTPQYVGLARDQIFLADP